MKKLNALVHPLVKKEILKRAKKMKGKVIVIDAPLLIETGMQKEVDKIIVVSAKKEKQLQRLMEENGLSEWEAIKRIHSQLPLRKKEKKADFVIENNFGLKELKKKTLEVWSKIKKDLGEIP